MRERPEDQMQALELIEKSQSGAAIANLAQTLGITEEQARAASEVALPVLSKGIERNTLSRSGLTHLVTALGQGHHEQILDNPASWTDPRVIADGEAVLNHITGSQQRTQALAERTALASGLGSTVIKLLLPILAQWLMGALTKSTKGGLGDILSRLPVPGGAQAQSPRPRPSSRDSGGFDTGGTMGDNPGFDLPKSDMPEGGYKLPWPGTTASEGSPGPQPVPQRPRTGFDLPSSEGPPTGGYPMPPIPPAPDDDYANTPYQRRGGGSSSPLPFPLPGPGDNRNADNPYGDLTDILRRGGRLPSGERAEGGGLWTIIRNTIGGALGFGNKGILGWIVQLLLLRWGWTFLRRILLGR